MNNPGLQGAVNKTSELLLPTVRRESFGDGRKKAWHGLLTKRPTQMHTAGGRDAAVRAVAQLHAQHYQGTHAHTHAGRQAGRHGTPYPFPSHLSTAHHPNPPNTNTTPIQSNLHPFLGETHSHWISGFISYGLFFVPLFLSVYCLVSVRAVFKLRCVALPLSLTNRRLRRISLLSISQLLNGSKPLKTTTNKQTNKQQRDDHVLPPLLRHLLRRGHRHGPVPQGGPPAVSEVFE